MMTVLWNELLEGIETPKSHWNTIKKDVGADKTPKGFLSRSYLVITQGLNQIKLSEKDQKIIYPVILLFILHEK